ncbi:MAG: hypothetical protein RIM33_05280 [Alphaproteobacteria bacterium]
MKTFTTALALAFALTTGGSAALASSEKLIEIDREAYLVRAQDLLDMGSDFVEKGLALDEWAAVQENASELYTTTGAEWDAARERFEDSWHRFSDALPQVGPVKSKQNAI